MACQIMLKQEGQQLRRSLHTLGDRCSNHPIAHSGVSIWGVIYACQFILHPALFPQPKAADRSFRAFGFAVIVEALLDQFFFAHCWMLFNWTKVAPRGGSYREAPRNNPEKNGTETRLLIPFATWNFLGIMRLIGGPTSTRDNSSRVWADHLEESLGMVARELVCK